MMATLLWGCSGMSSGGPIGALNNESPSANPNGDGRITAPSDSDGTGNSPPLNTQAASNNLPADGIFPPGGETVAVNTGTSGIMTSMPDPGTVGNSQEFVYRVLFGHQCSQVAFVSSNSSPKEPVLTLSPEGNLDLKLLIQDKHGNDAGWTDWQTKLTRDHAVSVLFQPEGKSKGYESYEYMTGSVNEKLENGCNVVEFSPLALRENGELSVYIEGGSKVRTFDLGTNKLAGAPDSSAGTNGSKGGLITFPDENAYQAYLANYLYLGKFRVEKN